MICANELFTTVNGTPRRFELIRVPIDRRHLLGRHGIITAAAFAEGQFTLLLQLETGVMMTVVPEDIKAVNP